MIALAKPKNVSASVSSAPAFEELLPAIERQVRRAFRRIPSSDREEMIAEAIADSYCAYARLVARGKADLAFATPLAQFSIRRIRCGRRVGVSLNIHDITSPYCQRVLRIPVERLNLYEKYRQEWLEVLIEDRKAGPAETAAARIDFADWLKSLRPKLRRIAKTLATGESTAAASRKFGVSAGRISQLRRELEDAWRSFQGETAVA